MCVEVRGLAVGQCKALCVANSKTVMWLRAENLSSHQQSRGGHSQT